MQVVLDSSRCELLLLLLLLTRTRSGCLVSVVADTRVASFRHWLPLPCNLLVA